MKKAAVIVQAKDASGAVSKLRSLGTVHVEYNQPPAGQDINALKEDINTVSAAINILDNSAYKKIFSAEQTKPADWKFVAKHIVDLEKRLEQLNAYSQVLNAQISEWEQWGDFDLQEIERLKAKGIYIGFYRIPLKETKDLPANLIAKDVFRSAGSAHYMIISQGRPELPFKELLLPKMGLEKMRVRAYQDQRLKELIVDDIGRYLVHLRALTEIKLDLEKQLEFHQALEGMGRQNSLAYLSGYLPFDEVENLEKAALEEQWGLSVRDVSEDDAPPVLLRNPRWIRLIEPVLKMLGIRPGYSEIDVSPVFLVFFGIFFGILIGDAGYGLAYLLLTFWFSKKIGINRKNANVFYLGYALSSCAVVWGILSGTFFGHEWLAGRGIRALVPALNDPGLMQRLCFFIGALHLSIAHGWRAVLRFPNASFIAELGWIAVLWVAFYLAGALILGTDLPAFCLPLALGGMAAILFFSAPRKNPLKALSAGFTSVTFGLGFMSAFTDVVSYVRLFAVGLAAVAIADTTNAMASGLGPGAVGILAGVLIVALGHALNIVLGPIAILVHGVRLNLLEFGLNHTGITWSGSVYKPLRESA